MRYNFCTLFDKNYLYKGVTLYNSVIKNCDDFKLWILCMDTTTLKTLQKLNLINTELITLSEIESDDEKLLSVKKERNAGEYSWTCKPSLLIYILKNNKDLKNIAYLDSDLFFFSSPEDIYKELDNNSIIITPHRFPPAKKYREKTKGKYNAGAIFFKNDENTKNCLTWWRKRCLKWCFYRYENGKLGDQMYLDSFPELFSGVHDIENAGVNLGPWGLSQYTAQQKENKIFINNNPLILFHFHSLKIFSSCKFSPGEGYNDLPHFTRKAIYSPYYKELKKAISEVEEADKGFNFGFSPLPNYLLRIKNFIKKYYHKTIAE